jgi:hypothetical protein
VGQFEKAFTVTPHAELAHVAERHGVAGRVSIAGHGKALRAGGDIKCQQSVDLLPKYRRIRQHKNTEGQEGLGFAVVKNNALWPAHDLSMRAGLSMTVGNMRARNLALVIGLLLFPVEFAHATCGTRGGPGYRAPNGRCVGWADIGRTCGSPPTLRCTPEATSEGADKALKPNRLKTPNLEPSD